MSDVAIRCAFLIRDGELIEASWMLGGELPDIDAIVATARELHVARGSKVDGRSEERHNRNDRSAPADTKEE